MSRVTQGDLRRFVEDCQPYLGNNPRLWTEVMAAETIAHVFGADSENGSPAPHWIMENVFGYGRGLKDNYHTT